MKPPEVRAAGLLFLVGGCTSFVICSILTLATFFLWLPAWMYGVQTAFYSMYTGMKLLGKNAEGSGFYWAPTALMFWQIINLDPIACACAWMAGVKLSQPEARRYLRKPMNFPPPEDPTKGRVQLDIAYHPAQWMLFMANPEVRIDGWSARRGWGHHSIEVEQGTHLIEVSYDYLVFSRLGLLELQVDVKAGEVNDLFYRDNIPWIFSKGVFVELGAAPQLPGASPEQPPSAGPPNDGMKPHSV